MVYRNLLFRCRKKLLPENQSDGSSEFIELEQVDGTTVFVSRSSLVKFCEHGVTPGSE